MEEPEEQVDATEVPESLVESNGATPDISMLWIEEGTDCILSTIYIYQDAITGRLRTVLWEPSPELRLLGMPEFPVETKWSVPAKSQIDSYRDRSSRYNQAARAVLVQRGRLEELLIQNHLLEMRLGSGEHQTVVDLQKDKKGVLTIASVAHINKLHPTVIELMLAKFIDEAALVI